MSSPKFVETHNVVMFLEKPEESNGFAEIIDFLKASSVTVNSVIYTSWIEQFWATAKVQTVNGVLQLQALVDKKRVIVTESSIRRDLHLDDAKGIDFLLTATIFEELARMRRITPLFDIMTIQATEEVGKDSDHLTDSTQIPIINQPSLSSQPKKKQPSKKAQRQEAEVPQDEPEHEERCSSKGDCCFKEEDLDVEKEENVKTYKFEETQEDLDEDAEVTLVNETQERQDDDLMFDSRVLDDDEMPVEATVDGKDEQSTKPDDSTDGEAVTTAIVEDSVVLTTIEEITLAQTLIHIKAAKPKVVTTAATTTTTIRPKARRVVVQEPNQIALDEQIARDIQAKLDAELIEEQKLAKKQEEEANIALIESWENTQAMMEADRLLAERLQSKEREELTDEEKAKLFMELMEKRRKHFAAL
ncbi:hypothetical protein Tco_0866507, partial [Tanacetum coccineum]